MFRSSVGLVSRFFLVSMVALAGAGCWEPLEDEQAPVSMVANAAGAGPTVSSVDVRDAGTNAVIGTNSATINEGDDVYFATNVTETLGENDGVESAIWTLGGTSSIASPHTTCNDAGVVPCAPEPGGTEDSFAANTSFLEYQDDLLFTVQLVSCDEVGPVSCTTRNFLLTVNNVAPQGVTPSGPASTNEGTTVTFTSVFSDPGALDTHTCDWVWGDGTSDLGLACTPASTITHTYGDNANYTVQLTVTDDDGGVTSNTASINVANVAPTVAAGADVTIDEGDTVTLAPATFHDAGSMDTHTATIDWGDGSPVVAGLVTETPVGPPGNPAGLDGTVAGSHLYADNGVFTVTVTVTDDNGGVTADSLIVTVNNVAPVVNAGADIVGQNEGGVVSVSGTFTDPGADTWTCTWVWNDGTTDGPNACVAGDARTHVYADNALYTVQFTVTDDDGAAVTDSLTIDVANVAPSVNAGGDQTVNEGDVVSLAPATFNDLGTLDTHTATINWGDGSPLAIGGVVETPVGPPGSTLGLNGSVTGSHVYADNGTFTVTVTVTDDNLGVTADQLVVTVNNVAPSADAGTDQVGFEGDLFTVTTTFTDPGSADTHTCVWSWGDTSPDDTVSPCVSGGTVTHVYADNSVYTVTLTVTDDDLDVGVDTLTIDAANRAPTVSAGADQTVSEGQSMGLDPATFNDLGTLDSHIATIDWGDGSPLDSGLVTETTFGPPGDTAGANGTVDGNHVYADNGTYLVTVTVTDDSGASTSDTFTVTVLNADPVADAGADRGALEGEQITFTAQFTDASTVDTHSCSINFGDGTAPVLFNPCSSGVSTASHTYADNANYTLTLTVTDDDSGIGSDTSLVRVENSAPVIVAGSNQTVTEGQLVSLSASFTDAGTADTHTAIVNWGDGSIEAATVTETPSGPPGSTTPASGTITGSHVYADDGVYTVVVALSDDDGAAAIERAPSSFNGTQIEVANSDDVCQSVVLPFGIPFAGGAPQANICISSNGNVQFGSSNASFTNQALPFGGFAGAAVIYWDDLFPPGGSGVFYEVQGSAPNRRVVVRWETLPYCCSSGDPLTLELVFFEASSEVEAHYVNVDDPNVFRSGGGGATIGMQISNVNATQFSFNPNTAVVFNGQYKRWVMNAGSYAIAPVTNDRFSVTVDNVAPTVNAGASQTALEGSTVNLAATFNDLGTLDTHTSTISWGDGTAPDVGVTTDNTSGPPGSTLGANGTVTGSHVYADDGLYTVTVTVTDDNLGVGANTTTVLVRNVLPTIAAGTDQSVLEGQTVNLDPSTFNDLGTLDTHNALVNWGDGTTTVGIVTDNTVGPPGSLTGANGTVAGSHVYADDGVYTVEVRLKDDDSSPRTFTGGQVEVANADDICTLVNLPFGVPFADGVPQSAIRMCSNGNVQFGSNSSTFTNTPLPFGAFNQAIAIFWDDLRPDLGNGVFWEVQGPVGDRELVIEWNAVPHHPSPVPSPNSITVQLVLFESSSQIQMHYIDTTFGAVQYDNGVTATIGVQTAPGVATQFSFNTTSVRDGYTILWDTVGPNYVFTTPPASDTFLVTVGNVAPVANAGADQTVTEGQLMTVAASFTDAGAGDTHTCGWAWGDGTTNAAVPCVTGATFSHVYADNGAYTVTLTVTDDNGGVGTDTLDATVTNVAPTVNAGGDQTVTEGLLVTLDPATFNDLGTLDSHTASIDWGDGSALDVGTVTETPTGPPGNVAGANGTVGGAHVYADNGTYTVTVTVTDDELASTGDSFAVTVTNVDPSVAAGSDRTVNEGSSACLLGAGFNDRGTADTHQTPPGGSAIVDWGEGLPETATATESPFGPPGSILGLDGTVADCHLYLDDTGAGASTIFSSTLTVTDDDGGFGSDAFTVTVNNVTPTADATGGGLNVTVGTEGSPNTFVSSFSDPGTLDTHLCRWEITDGTTLALLPGATTTDYAACDPSGSYAPTYTFPDQGTWTATLFVLDNDGAEDSDSISITVVDVEPLVTFWQNDTGPVNESNLAVPNTVTFTADIVTGAADGVSDDITACIFDAGDGSPVITAPADSSAGNAFTDVDCDVSITGVATVTHLYTDDTGGPFRATLIVHDEDSNDATPPYDETQVNVDGADAIINNVSPVINLLTYDDNSPHPEGQFTSVQLDWADPSQNLVFPVRADTYTVDIDWNDSSADTYAILANDLDFNTSHLYSNPGTYNIVVTVTDDDGDFDTILRTIVVTDVPLDVISVSTNAPIVENGEATVWIVANGTSASSLAYSYDWNGNGLFDDGAAYTNIPDNFSSFTRTDDTEELVFPVVGAEQVAVKVLDTVTLDSAFGVVEVAWFNEAPTVVSAIPAAAIEDAAAIVTITVNDVSPDDEDVGFLYQFDWNADGDFADAGESVEERNPVSVTPNVSGSGSHVYADPGNYLVTVRVTDEGNDFAETQVVVAVGNVNSAVVAVDDFASVNEDDILTLAASALTANDTDADGDSLSVTAVGGASNGTVSLAGGVITFTPTPANYNGPASFIYTVSDGTVTDTGLVSITVVPVNDLPVVQDDAFTVVEDAVLTVAVPGVLANDSDIEGALTVTVAATTQHGTLTLNANGSFTYDSNLNYFGTDSFTYTALDSNGATRVGSVSIEVTALNDVPVAQSQPGVTTAEDEPVAVVLSAFDEDGDPLTYAVVTGPANGTLTGTAPNLTYVPTSQFFGGDSFTFRANDGTVDSNLATVTIVVSSVNDLPVASDDAYTVVEDAVLSVAAPGVLANDSDVEGALTVAVAATTQHGTLALAANGSFTYDSNPNYFGSDSFTYTATDLNGATRVASVSIEVTPVNDAPVAQSQPNVTTAEDVAVAVVLSAFDEDGDSLTYAVVTGPASGTLTGDAPNLTYVPDADSSGTDSFTFTANDGTVDSNLATVTIDVSSVNDLPVALDDAYTVAEDAVLTVAAPGVLANDSDVEGALTATVVATTQHGTLTLAANGSFTYDSNLNYVGSDSFTYTATDSNGATTVASVSIEVTAVNDAPVAQSQPGVTTAEDEPVAVVLSAFDQDGDSLTYAVVTGPANGSLTGTAPNLTYVPNSQFFGDDSFTFRANDGTVNSALATVTINVSSVNDLPVALDDAYTVAEDAVLSIAAPGVLANDSDVEGALTVAVAATTQHGTLALAANGSFTYDSNLNYVGSDSFTYTATDSNGATTVASVSIEVTPVNDAPVAQSQPGVTTAEDVAVAVVLSAFDEDGDSLTYAVVTGPANGSLTGTAPNLTYVPNSQFFGGDSFTFRANDGTVNSALATVTINVSSVNDLPVALDDAYTVAEDAVLTIAAPGVLANDSDVEGALTATVVATTQHGTLTLAANGSFTYDSNPNYVGSDSFTYTATDSNGATTVASVSIEVTPVNDAPVAQSQPGVVTAEDEPVAVVLSAFDQDGDSLTYAVVTGPTNGSLTGTAPNLTYVPNSQFFGGDSFTFRANDGTVNSTLATVTINVTSVNDPPVALDDAYTVAEDAVLTIAAPGVLANDSDVEGALTATVVATTQHGTLTLAANGSFTYDSVLNYVGSDSFTYTATDSNGATTVASVSIEVTAVNDAPVAVADSVTTDEDQAITIQVLTNDIDVDGNSLTVTNLSAVANGTVSSPDGTSVLFTPNANFNGATSFTYTAFDGTVASAAATVTINVTSINDLPVATGPSNVVVGEDSGANAITLTSTDVETVAASRIYVILASPAHGTIVQTGTTSALTYAPASNYFGDDQFTWVVRDTDGGQSAPLTTQIVVTPVGPAITTFADVTGNEGQTMTFTVAVDDPALSFQWDWENDGTFDTTTVNAGATSAIATHVFTDDAAYTVRVRVTDAAGITVEDTALATIANVDPTLVCAECISEDIDEGHLYQVLPSETDPGSADTHTWSMTIDPIPATPPTFSTQTGLFGWVPTYQDAGCTANFGTPYDVTITVTDDDNGANTVAFTLNATWRDDDLDGMSDTWETSHGLNATLDDSTGDVDGDGISNIDAFNNDSCGPYTPDAVTQVSPLTAGPGAEDTTTDLELAILETDDQDGPQPLDYIFQVYDGDFDSQTGNAIGTFVATGTDSPGTSLTLTVADPTDLDLTDNTYYWWRVRATDGSHPGAWSAFQRVFYNPTNDAPTAPLLASPLDTASVASLTPVLVADNASDLDDFLPWGDLTLRFDVASDDTMTTIVATQDITPQGSFGNTSWVVDLDLADNTWYWWTVTAIDPNDHPDGSNATTSAVFSFFVNTANDEPTTPTLISPADSAEVNTAVVTLTVGNSTDPEAQPLTYFFEWASSPTFSTADYGSASVAETQGQTSFTTPALTENTTYWWRVRASDGYTSGPFVMASFFVNATNDAPGAPIAINPSNGALVDRDDVVLTAANATDPDINDTLTYHFQIYKSLSSTGVLSNLVDDSVDDVATGVVEGLGTTSWAAKKLKAGKSYYWVATAIDNNGLEGAQSVPQKFETLSVGGGGGCSVSASDSTDSGLSILLLGLSGLAGVVVLRRRKNA